MESCAKERIFLNQAAQGLASLKEAEDWFLKRSKDNRKRILRELSIMALQAGFVPGDVESVVESFDLERTFTPCVLLSSGLPKIQVGKALMLPEVEAVKTFRLLLGLLSVADQRRRVRCGKDCRHWWHRDLSDESTVAQLLGSGGI